MNTKVLFISPDYLKDNSMLDENIEDEKLVPNIRRSQDRYIYTALGENLYVKIIDYITKNTLSGNYLTLMTDYIRPCLVEYSIYESLPYVHFNITNKSIEIKDGENQEAVETEDLIYLRNNIEDMAMI